MYTKRSSSFLRHWDFFLLDALVLIGSFLLAYWLRFPHAIVFALRLEMYRSMLLLILLSEIATSLMLQNLHNILKRDFAQEGLMVIILTVSTLAVTALVFYLMHDATAYSRLTLLYCMGIFFCLDLLFRTLWKKHLLAMLKRRKTHTEAMTQAFLLTDAADAADFIARIGKTPRATCTISAVGLVDAATVAGDTVAGCPLVGGPDASLDYICRNWIDEVFVYLPQRTAGSEAFLSRCAEMGVTVHMVLAVRSASFDKQIVEHYGDFTVLTTAYNFLSLRQQIMKRALDICGGLIGSLCAVVIGIFICPIIYIKSPGPVIFRQTRIGQNGKPFQFYKFRSMYLDAEERKKELMKQNRVADGMMFKLEHDPRIIGNVQLPDGTWQTGIGEFIRRTSLDEFPQFFNVLKGDMSLVGTRPPTLDEWAKYRYHHRARLATKPGITGMWQVSGRSKITDFEEVVRLDTEYITKYRFWLDIQILAKTVVSVLKHDGSM